MLVPAHQEEATVGRCLEALLRHAEPGELEVVVAANGCTDRTTAVAADSARRWQSEVRILDLAEASKAYAIRAAEAVSTAWPRVYLDADVVCPTSTVRALVHALEDTDLELVVPERRLDLAPLNRGARAYYRRWTQLPWVQDQLSGRGCYVLSSAGRARFGAFPDLVADDGYVTTVVPAERTCIVAGAPVTVHPPRDLRTVVRVRTRVYAGNLALARTGNAPAGAASARSSWLEAATPERWPDLIVYAGATALAKARAHRQLRGGAVSWGRVARSGVAV